jgi:hypothetical protein
MNKKRMHPGGMPETHVTRFWHPSGMRFLSAIITGGIVRQASLNHRLKSGKPPACPGGLAKTAAFAITAAFAETALPQKPLSRNISYVINMLAY